MSLFEVHPDICKARTLGSEFYTDRSYFELSRERIFARSWQFIAHISEIPGLYPAVLLPGVLDEPVLVVKTDESYICLSNVCTHRGKVLVESPCRADLIRCSYHGRRFSLDGSFLSMPEFEGVEGFPTSDDDLRKLPMVEKMGFLLAGVEPEPSFEEYGGEAFSRIPDECFSGLKLTERREFAVRAHWALYCENYLEGFHIPYVHPGLNAVVDYGSYATEIFGYSSLQTAFDDDGAVAARYLFLFPNTMFNFYPWGVSVNVVRPVNHQESVVEFLIYIRDESLVSAGTGVDLYSVELEDEAVVESVQRGIRSRSYGSGRYSPSREQGTHHFHRLIAEFMR